MIKSLKMTREYCHYSIIGLFFQQFALDYGHKEIVS